MLLGFQLLKQMEYPCFDKIFNTNVAGKNLVYKPGY